MSLQLTWRCLFAGLVRSFSKGSHDWRWWERIGKKLHLGYLTQEQYAFAFQWVLNAHRERAGTDGAGSSTRRLPGATEIARRKLLNRLGGNAGALERLVARERERKPYASELDLYRAASDWLDRDRR